MIYYATKILIIQILPKKGREYIPLFAAFMHISDLTLKWPLHGSFELDTIYTFPYILSSEKDISYVVQSSGSWQEIEF